MSKASVQLWLIRHGECLMNLRKKEIIMGRSNDSPLTEQGQQQAFYLGKFLQHKRFTFDQVYSSPAVRAIHTTQLVLEQLEKSPEIVIEDDLQEQHQGAFEQQSRAVCYTPDIVARMANMNMHWTPPEGESLFQVEERMLGLVRRHLDAWLVRSQELDRPARVALFCHGGAVRTFFHGIMKNDPTLTHHMAQDNTAVTEFVYELPRGWRLVRYNDTRHLDVAPLLLAPAPAPASSSPSASPSTPSSSSTPTSHTSAL
eukprot:TRINITY_DN4886_c0_g1_i3.p1 TRINITY_DN4886_c0_g1~~TRINITY_DN4886_c0_g1_i3.p1  ORF type:complete len:257 (+),score=73.91 TRINITY_DN4886_c0_g1_i3:42-812(+)